MHPTDDMEAASTDPASVADPTPAEGATGGGSVRGRAAMSALAELDGLELAAHPDLYERVHHELRSALTEIDDA